MPATPSAPGTALVEALAFAHPESRGFRFTDWARIRAVEGAPVISDDPADEERARFVADVHARHATPSYFAGAKLSRHGQVWGWDNTDLSWEATIEGGDADVYVLRLPDAFEVAALEATFIERGYERTEHAGNPLYTRRILPSDEWLGASDLAIGNTAVLADAHIVVMSRDIDGVRGALDARGGTLPSLAEEPWADEALESLGNEIGVRLIASEEQCLAFYGPYGPLSVFESDADRPGAYEWFGAGYRYEDERPLVTVVMGYEDESEAEEDLEYRVTLATELDVLDYRRDGTRLVYEIRPAGDQPSLLLELSWVDYLFAVC